MKLCGRHMPVPGARLRKNAQLTVDLPISHKDKFLKP